MRYILDDNGYIYSVSCNPIECNNKGCTGYTGATPEGYDSIELWATTANIRAYKIVDGNLVYDEARAAALEAEWAECRSNKNYIQVRPNTDYTIQKTNTSEIVPLTYQMVKGGNKLILNSNGTITIGAGVSRIKVSSSITFANVTTSTTKNLYYYLNEENARFVQSYAPANYSTIVTIADYYIDVNEGDNFSLRTYGTAGEVIRGTRSHLSIEVIE
jgi:hypothetical protein